MCTHISGVVYLFEKWLLCSHCARFLSKHTRAYSPSFIVLYDYCRLYYLTTSLVAKLFTTPKDLQPLIHLCSLVLYFLLPDSLLSVSMNLTVRIYFIEKESIISFIQYVFMIYPTCSCIETLVSILKKYHRDCG